MITDRFCNELELVSHNGRFTFACYPPTESDVRLLKSNGFEVLPPLPTYNPKNRIISWEKAIVSGDLESIDLSSPALTEAQRLWIIATLSNKKKQ